MRSLRRHHAERLKAARRTYYGNTDNNPKRAGRAVNTATVCSCWMCGNPRRHLGEPSRQERSAAGLFRRLGFGDGAKF